MSVDLRVLDDPDRVCGELLLEAAQTGGHMVVTGGSGPKAAYAQAAGRPQAWAGTRLWFTDERCVLVDDERSNYGMVNATLLQPIASAGVAIGFSRRMLGELGPEQGALEYERALAELGGGAATIQFELILVGMGPDAHVCSMFPGQESLAERERLVVGVPIAGMEPLVPRITLTFAAVGRARRVVVLAKGAAKADAIGRAFADDARPSVDVPASLLAEHANEVTVLLDSDAAKHL